MTDGDQTFVQFCLCMASGSVVRIVSCWEQAISYSIEPLALSRDYVPHGDLTDLLLTLVGWDEPFSTRRVDFLSIKLGIRVCRDICGLSNRSSSPHDSLFASLPSGLIITASPTSRSPATPAERVSMGLRFIDSKRLYARLSTECRHRIPPLKKKPTSLNSESQEKASAQIAT